MFKRAEAVVVVEIPAGPAPGDPAAIQSLAVHPGFRHLLYLLRTECARVDGALLRGTHTELSRVTFLQGARAGLRHVEQILSRFTGEAEKHDRQATAAEREAFDRAKTLIEEVK